MTTQESSNITHIRDTDSATTLEEVRKVVRNWRANEQFGGFTRASLTKDAPGGNELRIEAASHDGEPFVLVVTGQVNFGFHGNGTLHAADILTITEAFGDDGEITRRLAQPTSRSTMELLPTA